MNTDSLTISDNNSNHYTCTDWSGDSTTVTCTHTAWTYNRNISITIDADSLHSVSLSGGDSYSWSFRSDKYRFNRDIPVTNSTYFDVSSVVSSADETNINIDDSSQSLTEVTSGNLHGIDFSQT